MKQRLTISAGVFALVFCTASVLIAAAPVPATQPVGALAGVIKSPGEVPLSEMVVYLVPDDNQQIQPPKETVKVSQKGAVFSPPLVIVCAGQTVEFLNDEDRPIEHNVFSNSPAKQFDLGLFKPGESRSVTFDKPGPVLLYCSIHRHMDGAVYVTPTPYFSRVDEKGNFRIDDVPPGHWVINTWQRRRRFVEAKMNVKVIADQTVLQDLELLKK
jgi:plastocyanin